MTPRSVNKEPNIEPKKNSQPDKKPRKDEKHHEEPREQLEHAIHVLQEHGKLLTVRDLFKLLRVSFAIKFIKFLWIAVPIIILSIGALLLKNDAPSPGFVDPPHEIRIAKTYLRGSRPKHQWLVPFCEQRVGEIAGGKKLVVIETHPFGPARSFSISVVGAGNQVDGDAFLYSSSKNGPSFVPLAIENSRFRIPSMSHEGLLYLLLAVQLDTKPKEIRLYLEKK